MIAVYHGAADQQQTRGPLAAACLSPTARVEHVSKGRIPD